MNKLFRPLLLVFFLTVIVFTLLFAKVLHKYTLCLKPTTITQVADCFDKILVFEPQIKTINRYFPQEKLTQILTLTDKLKVFMPYRDYLLGQNQGRSVTYLVLLQNDNELRTNGGFFGSYAVIEAVNGHFDIRFQDIYVPDGQLPGHVDPPAPIQEAFQQGWFRLRDSDWKADFPTDAATIRWFLENGKEINPDILVTLNLNTIRKIVDISGPFTVPEFNTTVTPENVYMLLQNKAEIGFFPGSTQKKDALSATGKAFVNHLSTLKSSQYLAILNLILTQLDKQNILINSKNPDFQNTVTQTGWDGQFKPQPCPKGYADNCISDTAAVIEANMGANKANCCINRSTTHTIQLIDNKIHHEIKIVFSNLSPVENPIQPFFYGGNYIDFLRFYLPLEAQDVVINTHPTLPTTLRQYPAPYQPNLAGNLYKGINYDFQELGFFHITRSGSQSWVSLSYTIPYRNQTYYNFSILKQHGLENSPQTIYLFDQPLTTNLEESYNTLIKIPH